MILFMPVMSINELTKRMNFNCIKTVLIAATAMISLNSFSQDLIARQAPIDRKLKSVDSLALQKQIRAEQAAYPALSLILIGITDTYTLMAKTPLFRNLSLLI